jgi:hypothetical protein
MFADMLLCVASVIKQYILTDSSQRQESTTYDISIDIIIY